MSDYRTVASFDALEENKLVGLEIDGRGLLLVRIGDAVHATSNVCPHAGSPLSNGRLVGAGTVVQCPLHGIRFRLADGSIVGNAVCERLEIYPVRLRDGRVEVALP